MIWRLSVWRINPPNHIPARSPLVLDRDFKSEEDCGRYLCQYLVNDHAEGDTVVTIRTVDGVVGNVHD